MPVSKYRLFCVSYLANKKITLFVFTSVATVHNFSNFQIVIRNLNFHHISINLNLYTYFLLNQLRKIVGPEPALPGQFDVPDILRFLAEKQRRFAIRSDRIIA